MESNCRAKARPGFLSGCHLLLSEGGSKNILGQTLAAVFGPTLDLDLIVDVEAGVFPGKKFFDLFPAEAYVLSLSLDHHGLAFVTYLKNNDLRSVGSAHVPSLHYTADGFFI